MGVGCELRALGQGICNACNFRVRRKTSAEDMYDSKVEREGHLDNC